MRVLKQLDIVVQLDDLEAASCNHFPAFFLHLFESLLIFLKQIHLKQVVLLKLGQVVPELLFLDDFVIVVRVRVIEVNI